ncbi:FAS-associated factor 2-like isoform X1 [Biomphalaria glabrata]|uniref:FAS-associated factor 2-like isoform X1 n=2 Tax=Biomphalaria glabrata TaxID=6526 RepID=A0A9U8EL12_BIOGL|nr:FAS-associated factor 2-like isoform X1 [Biomphalaria glabrata]KAI8730658.1 FAS-associated factor 2-like isoform X1 [Biomphalaria glabrata]KAI8764604.1 FAS-associated factor 2 isoform X1 [Biomphalaria glabrata]
MDDSQDDLTSEQTEKLLQFQDLTGIDQIQRCRQILEGHDWNIEAAVQDTFNEQEGAPTVFHQPASLPEERAPLVNLQPSNQRVIMYPGRRPQGIFQWTYYLLSMPIKFVWSTLFDIIRVFVNFLRPDPRRSKCLVTDPLRDVMTFISNFDAKYGQNHPAFYQGTYSQALNDAKKELRFLLVYLHCDEHQNTDQFCRDIVCSQVFRNYVNGHLLFWACNTSSPEGYSVSQALKEHAYPFLALIVLRDNKMSVVARIEGRITSALELVARLEQVIAENESSLVAARADRAERSFNQTLRQQQDEAYLESLKADQEKEKRKREERERKEEEERRQRLAEEEKQRQYLQREQRKSEIQQQMPPEPDVSHPDSIRIMLKTPNGKRIERRFLRDQSIKWLYYYVFCHQDCPDDFQIKTSYPSKTLPCEPSDHCSEPPTFADMGLGKSEMLYVFDNEA